MPGVSSGGTSHDQLEGGSEGHPETITSRTGPAPKERIWRRHVTTEVREVHSVTSERADTGVEGLGHIDAVR